ncbi:hypothetical protein JHK87_015856 [Glycine soja]|nr:hypothetical protein JHK87_015856 [Glycine soja]
MRHKERERVKVCSRLKGCGRFQQEELEIEGEPRESSTLVIVLHLFALKKPSDWSKEHKWLAMICSDSINHGRSKKCTEEIKFDDRTIGAIPSPTPHGHLPDDDNVEEGEILEDEVLDGEVGKQETESDAEPGEIKGHLTKISVTRNEDIRDDKFISPAINAQDDVSRNCSSFETRDGKHAQACTDGVGNGFLDPKSSKGDKWHNGELGHFKSNEKLKGDFDDETLEANVRKAHYNRNSSSESGG